MIPDTLSEEERPGLADFQGNATGVLTVKEAYLPAVALQSTIVLLDNKYFYWSNN
jgi:hypothetical protein